MRHPRSGLSILLILLLVLQSAAAAQVHGCRDADANTMDQHQRHAGHVMHDDNDEQAPSEDTSVACECGCYCGGVCMHACTYSGVVALFSNDLLQASKSPQSGYYAACLNAHPSPHERPPNIA